MPWQENISTMVRHLISDVDYTNYKYSQQRLETTILVAAQLLITETDLKQPYFVDLEQTQLLPDPTDPNTRDDDFLALVSFKCACIILGSEARLESGNAISIKDGPSAIDLRGVSSTLIVLYKDLCAKYDQMLLDYRSGNSLGGHAIIGPYAPGSDYITRNYSDVDHRGGYFNY